MARRYRGIAGVPISWPEAQRIAAGADLDPRTIVREVRAQVLGEPPVRGKAGERARIALAAAGIPAFHVAIVTEES